MKTILDQHQSDISEIISLQNLLSNLDESNLGTTIGTIKTSKFIQSQDYLKVFLVIIGKIINHRKNQIPSFFKLIDEFFPLISSNFSKTEIMYLFSQKIIFIKLFHDNFISNEDIVEFYGIKSAELIYFYPEVHDFLANSSIYNENIKNEVNYSYIIDDFMKRKGEKIGLTDDIRLKFSSTEKIAVFIQNDDIDSFQQVASQNNINIKTHKIKMNDCEVNEFLSESEIYMTEYAAYHSSLKIFKFLLMNDSNYSHNLFQYALCGGNSEIIHLSEDLLGKELISKDIDNILTITIANFRNDLSDYLIENYDIQMSQPEFLCKSIIYENYIFFFNHILEFETEYNELLDQKEKSDDLIKNQEYFKEMIIFAAADFCPFLLQIILNFKNIDVNTTFDLGIAKKGEKFEQVTNLFSFAIQSFNNKNAKFLFSLESVDPDYVFFNNITPFIWACYVGNLEMVEFLYNSKKVNVLQIVNQSNENALHVATRMCNLDVVKFLVSLKIFDLSAKSSQNETALQTAARLGFIEIFDFLKEQSILNGIEIDDNLKPNEEKSYPSKKNKNPLEMGMDFYQNLKEQISVCLLI